MLTPDQVAAILAEFERRWRARTPARCIMDAHPLYKVPWSETLSIVEQVTGRPRTLQDRLDLRVPVNGVLRRLKREYPDLRW